MMEMMVMKNLRGHMVNVHKMLSMILLAMMMTMLAMMMMLMLMNKTSSLKSPLAKSTMKSGHGISPKPSGSYWSKRVRHLNSYLRLLTLILSYECKLVKRGRKLEVGPGRALRLLVQYYDKICYEMLH